MANDRLRDARVRQLLTQAELATLLGVRAATVSAWERGTVPRLKMQRAIAKRLGVSAAELFGGHAASR